MRRTMKSKTHGYSMIPAFFPGEILYIKKIHKDNVKIGDIVVFYKNRQLIAHRVIWITRENLIVKGDNSIFFDEPITRERIVGVVTKIKGRYGTIELAAHPMQLCKYYFWFVSLASSFSSVGIFTLSRKILRGRTLIIKLLAKH